jgi:hypothetical protein
MGNAFFITEKQTEEWLQLETRTIQMPDGTRKPITYFRLIWRSLDYLILCGNWSTQELVDLAFKNAAEVGGSFEQNFAAVLTYVHHQLRQKQGID